MCLNIDLERQLNQCRLGAHPRDECTEDHEPQIAATP
jgi:hypothetical protein